MIGRWTLLSPYVGLVYRQTGSLTRAARFALRSLLRFQVTGAWIRFIESAPYLAQASERVRSVLVDKIHRPFSHCAYGPAERASLLKQHYQTAEALFSPDTLLGLVNGERMILARLEAPGKATSYVFTLCREMISQHQGELTFRMMDEAQTIPMAMLMVNLSRDAQGRKILILNGIQGPGAEYKSQIVRLTRDLCGLRPKRAVLEVAYAFAAWAGIEIIVATAIANHVSQAKLKWQRKIHADYDDFWREFGPGLLPNGDFAMPVPLPRRNVEEVAAKKRKLWLARQELLQNLDLQTAQTLAALIPNKA